MTTTTTTTTSSSESLVPEEFICPITQEIMTDPVVSRYGQSYERTAIVEWLASGSRSCPLTRQPLTLRGLVTNSALRTRIRTWQVAHSTNNNPMEVHHPKDPQEIKAFLSIDQLAAEEDSTDRITSDEEEEEDDDDEDIRIMARRVVEQYHALTLASALAPSRRTNQFHSRLHTHNDQQQQQQQTQSLPSAAAAAARQTIDEPLPQHQQRRTRQHFHLFGSSRNTATVQPTPEDP